MIPLDIISYDQQATLAINGSDSLFWDNVMLLGNGETNGGKMASYSRPRTNVFGGCGKWIQGWSIWFLLRTCL